MTEINVNDPDLVPIRSVPDMLPRNHGAKKAHIATVYRWMERGILTRGGSGRVKLSYIKVGGRRLTSIRALNEFVRQLSEEDGSSEIETPGQRNRRHARAKEQVERLLYGNRRATNPRTGRE